MSILGNTVLRIKQHINTKQQTTNKNKNQKPTLKIDIWLNSRQEDLKTRRSE